MGVGRTVIMNLAQLKATWLEIEPAATPVPATTSEVESLEAALGQRLPHLYREWLLWAGQDFCGRAAGTDWRIGTVLDNTQYLPELLRENGVTAPLPARFVCWSLHQGYVAHWFALPNSDDPEGQYFAEGSTNAPADAGTFSTSLIALLALG